MIQCTERTELGEKIVEAFPSSQPGEMLGMRGISVVGDGK
jgi:hypothetical protein